MWGLCPGLGPWVGALTGSIVVFTHPLRSWRWREALVGRTWPSESGHGFTSGNWGPGFQPPHLPRECDAHLLGVLQEPASGST